MMIKLMDCLDNGAGTCRNEELFEALELSCEGYRNKNKILAEELQNMRSCLKTDEVDILQKQLDVANSALVSMVQQYTRDNEETHTYSHDFMSAGEEAFQYLVEHGLARWTDDKKYQIVFDRA